MGLLAGTVLGAGLGMLLAPKAGSELRGAIGEQARNLGNKASEQYRRASESASGWAEKGREFVNQARDAVSRGAEETRELRQRDHRQQLQQRPAAASGQLRAAATRGDRLERQLRTVVGLLVVSDLQAEPRRGRG